MDFTCILSALLFFVGNLLKLIYLGKESGRDAVSWLELKQLEPEFIQKEWEFRLDNRAHLFGIGWINSAAWFFFCFPILQLAYALNQQKGRGTARSVWLHAGIVIMTLGGAFTEWIANFMYIGSTLACQLMINEFNLQNWGQWNDDLGYRALEVAYFAIRGMKFWVDAFEWIALATVMFMIHLAVCRYRAISLEPFGACWNALGLFIGLLSLLDFVTEVLRVTNFRLFSAIAFWYGTVNRLIFIPLWLIVLGWRLPYALLKLEEEEEKKETSAAKADEVDDLALN